MAHIISMWNLLRPERQTQQTKPCRLDFPVTLNTLKNLKILRPEPYQTVVVFLLSARTRFWFRGLGLGDLRFQVL